MTPEHERVRKIASEILTSAEARLKRMGAPARPPDVVIEQTIGEQIAVLTAVMGCGPGNPTEGIALMKAALDVQDCHRAIEYANQLLQTVTDDNAAVILAAFRLGQTVDRVALLRPIAEQQHRVKMGRIAGAAASKLERAASIEQRQLMYEEFLKMQAENSCVTMTRAAKILSKSEDHDFSSFKPRTIRRYLAKSKREAENVASTYVQARKVASA